MNHLKSIALSALGGITLASCGGEAAKQPQAPNVIYVFPDQFRNHALSFWGDEGYAEQVNFQPDPTHTPALNQFAQEAVVLTSAISNFPLSSPHRGMLLSGMYPERSGVTLNCNSDRPVSSLRQDIETISDVYAKAGYDCGYIGKLHVEHPTKNNPQNPGHYVEDRLPAWDAYTAPENRHSFNYWYSYGTYDVHKAPHYWDNEGNRHEIKEWSPKHEADKAIEYINNTQHARAGGDKPFFLMVSMNPPHNPYQSLDDVMEEDYNRYKDKPIDSLLVRPNADKNMQKAKRATPFYFAAITGIDREFGRIVAAVEQAGIADNTIIVFASDHGETMCSQGTKDPKNSPYAESINIPFIVRYPQKLKPRVDHLLLSTPDIMPTLLGLSGLSQLTPKELDGRDFSQILAQEPSTIERPTSALYMQNGNGKLDENKKVIDFFPNARGVKTATHTLAIYINRDKEVREVLMFDDEKDPYQLNNLDYKEHKELFNRLTNELGSELKRIDDRWYKEQILTDFIPYN